MKNTLRFLKKLTPMLALAVLMMAPNWGWGQGTESFTHSSTSSSYGAINWTGTNGLAWTSADARGDQVITPSNKAICIRQTNGKITGPLTPAQQAAGIGKITFTAKNTAAAGDNTKATTYQFKCGSITKTVTIPAMGTNSVVVESPEINSTDATSIEITITGLSGVRVTIDDLSWTSYSGSTPTITLTPTTLTGFTYVQGSGPSAEQTFTVAGSNLTADISLATSTNYEISKTSGSGYATPLTFTPAQVATPQTVYVRLKAGLVVGTYDNEFITATSAGATDKTVTCSGSVTAPPPPDAPVATAATAITATGFTANWNAVAEATGYGLDIYTKAGSLATVLSENFNGFTAGTTGSGANSTDISETLDDYTQTPGWTGSKVYQAGGTAKMGGSSALGYIVTPEIDLSGNSGNFNIAFEAMAWLNDATELKIYLDDVLVYTAADLNNTAAYTLSTFEIDLTGGTATSNIRFEGNVASKGRFFLENLVITQGGGMTHVSGSPFTVFSTSKAITGLTTGTAYYYVVRVTTANGTSVNSNEIEVTTTGNIAPVIDNIVQTPATTVDPSTTVSVSADVTDTDGTIEGVELHWGTVSGALTNNIDMSLFSGNTYTTESSIPAQAAGTIVYYEVYAMDNESAETTSPVKSYLVIAGEPTNHVGSFAAIANSSVEITVTWTDSDAANYLIKGSSIDYASIVTPVDGTAENDGALVANITSGVGTYQFDNLTPNTKYYFKIFPYNGMGTAVNYKTNATVPQADATTNYGTPATPIATEATLVNSTSFTANWEVAAGATGYELDVYTKSGGTITTVLSENFNGFIKGTPDGGANSADVSATLDTYTQTPGWTGSKVYEAGGTAKMGGSSALGYIVTPEIDLSGNLGNFNLSFEGMAWLNDATSLKVFLNDALVYTATGLNNTDYTLSPFEVDLSGGTATSKIKFEGEKASKGRFFLENLIVTQGSETITPIAGSPFIISDGALTSKEISGLELGITYYYKVRATNAEGTSAKSNEISVITHVAKVTTQAGDWNTITWNPAGIPTAADDVIINHVVTISATGTANCNNLGIGIGTLEILSDASGTGSLITTGSVTGNVAVNRYIPGASEAWHLLSSPVANQAISGDFTPSGTYGDGTGYDFYAWDEPTAYWLNKKDPANGITNFNPGQGYLVAYQSPNTKIFTGNLNNGNVSSTLKYIASGDYKGSNLIGNPYASGIDWNLADRSKFADEFAYVYNAAKVGGEGYITVDGSSANAYIGISQGFMVLAKSDQNNVTFNFTNAMRAHGGSFYKNTNAVDQLQVRFANATNYDETTIRLSNESDFIRDRNDAVKMFSYNSSIPQVYTLTSDLVKTSINTIPTISEEAIFALSLYVPGEDNYVISLPVVEGEFAGRTIYLEDKLTGSIINLSESQTYAFAATPSDDVNRFLLTFNSTVGIHNPDAANAIQVYSNGEVFYVATSTKESALVNVYNLTGQLVMQGKTGGNSLSTFNASALSNGVYVINVIHSQGVVSQKVVIRK